MTEKVGKDKIDTKIFICNISTWQYVNNEILRFIYMYKAFYYKKYMVFYS